MWISFAICSLFYIALLYIPGYFLLKPAAIPSFQRAACAPIISVSFILLISICLSTLKIQSSWLGIACLLVIPSVSSVCISRWMGNDKLHPGSDVRAFFAAKKPDLIIFSSYIAFGVLIAGFFFVRNLDSASSITQLYDNYSHLNGVRELYDSGYYFDLTRGIYPQAWLSLAALGSSFLDGAVPVSINSLNYILMAVVLPLSIFLFISTVLPNDRKTLLFGSVSSLAFIAFPYCFISFGPLFPNLSGYSMVPISISLLALSLSPDTQSKTRILRMVFYFPLSIFAIFFLHQSAFFVGVVIAVPLLCHIIWTYSSTLLDSMNHPALIKFAMIFITVIVACAAWIVVYKLPMLQNTVSFAWASFQSPLQALYSLLTLSLTKTNSAYTGAEAAQITLAIVVATGIAFCLIKRRNIWLVVCFIIAGSMYIINTSMGGSIKSLLTGFWYNDSFRVAAIVALIGIPLAAIGLSTLFTTTQRLIIILSTSTPNRRYISASLAAITILVFGVLNYYPCIESNGRGATTAFGIENEKLREVNSLAENENALDIKEIDFLNEVKKTVPGNSVIINIPYDGSLFSYGTTGLDVYFRRYWYDEPTDINASNDADSIIRSKLSQISTDKEVQNAAKQIGAEYVLLLDSGNIDNGAYYMETYTPEWWVGITSISDSTEGFEIVLSKDDMRLYKISTNDTIAQGS